MKKLFALAAMAVMLTGCVVPPPYYDGGPRHHRGHDRDDDQGQDYDGGRYHCPPGQAKKGNC